MTTKCVCLPVGGRKKKKTHAYFELLDHSGEQRRGNLAEKQPGLGLALNAAFLQRENF